MAEYDEQGGVWRDATGRAYSDRGLAEQNHQSIFGGQSDGGAGAELLDTVFGGGKKKKKQPQQVTLAQASREAIREYTRSVRDVAYGRKYMREGNYKQALVHLKGVWLANAESMKLDYASVGERWPWTDAETFVPEDVVRETNTCYVEVVRLRRQEGKFDKALELINEAGEYAKKRESEERAGDLREEKLLCHIGRGKAQTKSLKAAFDDFAAAAQIDSANEELRAVVALRLAEMERRVGEGDGEALIDMLEIYKIKGMDEAVYARPAAMIRKMAGEGNARAEYCLAVMTDWGYGGQEKNAERVAELYKSAAKKGDKLANEKLKRERRYARLAAKSKRFGMGWKMNALVIVATLSGLALGAIHFFPAMNSIATGGRELLIGLGAVLVVQIVCMARRRYLPVWILLAAALVGIYLYFR